MISEQHHGFMPRKSTIDAMLDLRVLHCVEVCEAGACMMAERLW